MYLEDDQILKSGVPGLAGSGLQGCLSAGLLCCLWAFPSPGPRHGGQLQPVSPGAGGTAFLVPSPEAA